MQEPIVCLSVGEKSGENLATAFVRELRALIPDVKFFGVGGEALRQEGVDIVAPGDPLAVMGYWNALKRLPSILRVRRRLMSEIEKRQPALFVGFDMYDFNLGVAAFARARGIKTAQYVAPMTWAWRADRLPKIAANMGELWCLFSFEPEHFAQHNINGRFVGHPAAETPVVDGTQARRNLSLQRNDKVLAVFVGSRQQELAAHLPTVCETMILLRKRFPDLIFLFPAVDDRAARFIHASLARRGVSRMAEIIVGDSSQILAAADIALVKSGTSTLEAALAETPHIVFYRLPLMAKWFAQRRNYYLPYFSLPNILLGEEVAPELIQDGATGGKLAFAVSELLTDNARCEAMRARLAEVRGRITGEGARATARHARDLIMSAQS